MVQKHRSPSKGSHSSEGGTEDDVSGYLPIKNKSLMKTQILKLTALQKKVIVDYSQKRIQESPKIHRKQKQTQYLV